MGVSLGKVRRRGKPNVPLTADSQPQEAGKANGQLSAVGLVVSMQPVEEWRSLGKWTSHHSSECLGRPLSIFKCL